VQFSGQAPLVCLYLCPGVMSDKAYDELWPPLVPQVARSVERVQPSHSNRGGVTDIVQPGGRHDCRTVFSTGQTSHSAGTPGDSLDVLPPTSQRSQQAFAE
jgi:hypothetical protein